MRPSWRPALFLAVFLHGACSSSAAEILVDVESNLVPGVEFAAVRCELFDHAPTPGEIATGARFREGRATLDDSFDVGQRVAEFAELKAGTYWVRVRLLDAAGEPNLGRLLNLHVRGRRLLRVLLTRDCRAATCPSVGGDPGASECLAGRCVSPGCTSETPELCPTPDCAEDSECGAAASACAEAQCRSGYCVPVPVAESCGAGEWCDPERGCRPLAGALDAGTPDAGLDAGTPDAISPMDSTAIPDTAQDGSASVFTRVQSGSAAILDGQSRTVADITAVDPNRSLLLFTVRGDSPSPSGMQVSGQLASSGSILFRRAGLSSRVDIEWFLVTSPLLTVQRGTSLLSGSAVDVPLAPVSMSSSFPVISVSTTGSKFDENDWIRAEIVDPRTLRLDVTPNGTLNVDVEWQVAEMGGARVEAGTLDFQVADLARTAPLLSAPDPSRSVLLYSYTNQEGTVAFIGQKLVRGAFQDASTVAFERRQSGTVFQLTWYVVELPSGSVVHTGVTPIDMGVAMLSPSIPDVPLDTSFALDPNLSHGGMGDILADDNPGSAWATLRLPDATSIAIERGRTLEASELSWFAVSLP